MIFGNLHYVYLFLLLVPVIILFFLANKRRQQMLESFAQKEILKDLLLSFDGRKRSIKAVIVFLALILCILALMRPQWGLKEEQEKRSVLDIIIAIDTSKSMLSEDVRPNRLALAKTVLKNLIKQMKGDRIGIIAFSGSAFLMCPLTVDYNAFLLSLNSIDVSAIPREGTSLSKAISESIKGFKGVQSKAGILLIISDGEDHEGDPVNAAIAAKNEGITIYTAGVGTGEGELIVSTDEYGNRSFLKDRQGNVVKSRLNEATLKHIASMTGGSYIRITDLNYDVPDIYNDWFSKMEKREFVGPMKKHYRDWFQIPLTVALFLLIWEVRVNRR